MSDKKKFKCKKCCENDEQGPCILFVPKISVNFNPQNCPFDETCCAEWVDEDRPF